MPEISRFFGIVIGMYHNDHPPPHFHVRYGSQHAVVEIEGLVVVEGHLSPRVRGLVTEWAKLNQDALRNDWLLAASRKPLSPIPPLE